jgi:hypothetical protein
VIWLLLQLTAGTPDERTWPVSGALARPDGVELRVQASRVERAWSGKGFREEPSAESRCAARAVVERKAFQARLRKGAPGIYQVSVREEEKDALAERIHLGGDLGWGSAPDRLAASIERLGEHLKTARKVAKGELPRGPDAEKAFSKGLANEEKALAELGLKSDFSASTAHLGRVAMLLRNAQLWNGRPADDGDGIFLESDVSFDSLDRALAAAPKIVAAELKASVASLLSLLAARAADKPKLLAPLRDVANKAAAVLQGEDLELAEATSQADVEGLPELRKRLEAWRAGLVEAP